MTSQEIDTEIRTQPIREANVLAAAAQALRETYVAGTFGESTEEGDAA